MLKQHFLALFHKVDYCNVFFVGRGRAVQSGTVVGGRLLNVVVEHLRIGEADCGAVRSLARTCLR